MSNAEPVATQTLKCPYCNAPLAVKPGNTFVTCAYCGSRVEVQHPSPGRELPAVPASQPALSSIFAASSFLSRHRRAFTLGSLLLTLAGFGLCVLLIGGVTQLMFRSNASFDLAMNMARSDPKVVAAFGAPIQTGLFIMGSVSTTGDRWEANYDIPIFGTQRSGTLHVQGNGATDEWVLDTWAHYQDKGEDVSIQMSAER